MLDRFEYLLESVHGISQNVSYIMNCFKHSLNQFHSQSDLTPFRHRQWTFTFIMKYSTHSLSFLLSHWIDNLYSSPE